MFVNKLTLRTRTTVHALLATKMVREWFEEGVDMGLTDLYSISLGEHQ